MSYPDWLEKTARATGKRTLDSDASAETIANLVLVLERAAFRAGLSEAEQIIDNHAEFYRVEYRPGAQPTARELAKAIELKREQCFQAPWPWPLPSPAKVEEASDV